MVQCHSLILGDAAALCRGAELSGTARRWADAADAAAGLATATAAASTPDSIARLARSPHEGESG
jgi:hypothetical protein